MKHELLEQTFSYHIIGKNKIKQERKVTSVRRSFYTLRSRSRGSIVLTGLSDFYNTKH